jgi:hypothetical protein
VNALEKRVKRRHLEDDFKEGRKMIRGSYQLTRAQKTERMKRLEATHKSRIQQLEEEEVA